MSYTVSDFSREKGVSEEVLADFTLWHDILVRWNTKINLVSQSAVQDFWLRHALDSWQLTWQMPDQTDTILDLGSGGGFPGLALAIDCKHRGQGHVTLVESAGKKANFLRAVIRQLSLPATVLAERAESLEAKPYDLISARAFAPLPRLLQYAAPFWGPKTQAILHKGQNLEEELHNAQKEWDFKSHQITSISDPEGIILTLTELKTSHDI